MCFVDWTNNVALHQFDDLVIVFARVNLDTHLGRHVRFGCRLTNAARFPNVMSKRFLAINMLAVMECQHSRESMRVFAGAHHYRIKFPGALKYFSKILLLPRS